MGAAKTAVVERCYRMPPGQRNGSVTEQQLSELMAAYQQGDMTAFERLYSALKPQLHQYLRMLTRGRGDADDLLQETFLQIHRSRRTHIPGRPVVPWVFAIARHVYVTSVRRRSRLEKREVTAIDALPEIPVPAAVEELADYATLRQVLGELPADQAEALTLHHVWGFSFQEIGSMLGIRPVTAKLRAFRGMRRLRQILETTVKPPEAAGRSLEQDLVPPRGKPIGRR